MSSVPLAVRLDGPDGSLNITKQITGLRTKSIAPGGYASVQFTIARDVAESLFPAFTDILVFDTENGQQVGGGRLMDQGRSVDESGQVWQVAALGEGLASMQDREESLFYIDSSLDYWRMERRSTKRVEASVGIPPSTSFVGEPGLYFEGYQTPAAGFTSSDEALMLNRLCQVTAQRIGGFGIFHREGVSTTTSRVRAYVSDATLTGFGMQQVSNDPWTTAGAGRQVFRTGVDFTTTNDPIIAGVQWAFTSTTSATDTTWGRLATPTIQAEMFGRTGAPRPSSQYSNEWVLASDIFIDLLARWCPRLDVVNASIETSAFQFTQLAWIDGITPMGIMEELFASEGAFTWAVWDKQASGLWETEFRSISTDVRYEASVNDGFNGPSPSTEVYNRTTVRGRVESGYPKATRVNGTVPDLDAAGITRSKVIDMGDETWSVTQSTQRANQFLNDSKNPPNAGTLTVARKVYDNFTGRWVKPYEIRPGYLVRVRGVQPTPDTLNSSGANGSTIFQIVSNEFSADQAASTLELDAFGLSTVRALAQLARRRNRKR